VKEITTGITTPLDAFVAVQNGEIYVEVGSTDAADRAVFKLFAGDGAKVVQGGEASVMGIDKPVVVERKRDMPVVTKPVAAPMMDSRGNALVLTIGRHKVFIQPKDGARVEATSNEGTKITSIVAGGEYLVLTIDGDQTIYLATDDYIEFDKEGVVVRLNGISHVYAALDIRGIYDEAVADPADASFTGTKNP
jgi:hypothetical protein